MSALRPVSRAIASYDDVITGRAVRSRTWYTAAELSNWCLGAGDVLVPAYNPGSASIAVGGGASFFYRVTPNGRAVARFWSWMWNDGIVENFTEYLSAKSAATQNISLAVTNTGGVTRELIMVSCQEGFRHVLDQDTTDFGVDLVSEQAREPIDNRDFKSVKGVFTAASASVRRVALVNQARPTSSPWATTSAVFSTAIALGCILVRKIRPSSTTGLTRWYFYCRASNATTGGELRITNHKAGTNVLLTVPPSAGLGAGFLWFTVDVNDFECEDLTEATGMPGGTFAEYSVELRRNAGAGTFSMATIGAEETP